MSLTDSPLFTYLILMYSEASNSFSLQYYWKMLLQPIMPSIRISSFFPFPNLSVMIPYLSDTRVSSLFMNCNVSSHEFSRVQITYLLDLCPHKLF